MNAGTLSGLTDRMHLYVGEAGEAGASGRTDPRHKGSRKCGVNNLKVRGYKIG